MANSFLQDQPSTSHTAIQEVADFVPIFRSGRSNQGRDGRACANALLWVPGDPQELCSPEPSRPHRRFTGETHTSLLMSFLLHSADRTSTSAYKDSATYICGFLLTIKSKKYTQLSDKTGTDSQAIKCFTYNTLTKFSVPRKGEGGHSAQFQVRVTINSY